MSVNPRGKGFEVYVKRGERRWRVSASTEAQAKGMEQAIIEALDGGIEPDMVVIKDISDTGKKTLGQVFDLVIALKWKGTPAEDTSTINANLVKAIIGPNTPIDEINSEHRDNLVLALEAKGNSNGTINRKLAALSVALNFAIKRGWRTKPLDLERKKESQGRIRFLIGDEEKRLLGMTRHLGYEREADLFTFLLDTGARISEALRLEQRDLTETHVTFWKTKNDLPRTIPLTERLKVLLNRLAEHQRPFDFEYEHCRKVWDRVRALLGFLEDEQWVIHMLRHTCASRLVQRGVPILVVQKWMGHKTITVTMRYAHLAPSNLDAAVSVLNPVAPVAELVDARDSKSRLFGGIGSSPIEGTILEETV